MNRIVLQKGVQDTKPQTSFLCFSLTIKTESEYHVKGAVLYTVYLSTLRSVPQRQQDVINAPVAKHLRGGQSGNHRQAGAYAPVTHLIQTGSYSLLPKGFRVTVSANRGDRPIITAAQQRTSESRNC